MEERGTDQFLVEVAGLSVRVFAHEPSLRIAPGAASLCFLADGAARGMKADLTVRVRSGDVSQLEAGCLVFDSGGVWKLFDLPDGSRALRFHDALSGERPYKVLVLGGDGTEAELVLDMGMLPASGPVDPLEFPLDELLFLVLLDRKGGIELHACGVRTTDGRGFLFAGHSGDGKTTMARLWEAVPGAIVLSDDRIVVRKGPAGKWEMHGTPWHGEAALAANVRVDLAGIFILDRGERNVTSPLPPMEAVAALLTRSFPPFHTPEAMARQLEFLDRLVRTVTVCRFEVRPGRETIETVLSRGR